MFNSIDDVLSPQESINNRTNIHVWIFVMPSVVLLAGVYLWLGSGRGFTLLDVLKGTLSWISLKFSLNAIDLDFVPTPILDFLAKIRFEFRRWISWVVMLWGSLKVYRAAVSYYTTQLIVTEQRLIVQTGILRLRTVEMPNDQLDAFDVNQNLVGRFLDFGHVIIHGTGGMSIRIPCVTSPFEFRKSGISTKPPVSAQRPQTASPVHVATATSQAKRDTQVQTPPVAVIPTVRRSGMPQ